MSIPCPQCGNVVDVSGVSEGMADCPFCGATISLDNPGGEAPEERSASATSVPRRTPSARRRPGRRGPAIVMAMGGVLVAAALAAIFLLQGGGAKSRGRGIILLRYKTGSESTEQRERGFLETLRKEYPHINILVDNEYAGTTQESALDKAQNLLAKYGNRVEGIFAVCEPNAIGVLKALEDRQMAGKVKFVAFDPSKVLNDGMSAGAIDGIVLQDPVTMGYQAVMTMVAHLEGETVEKRISTGEYVATPENMNGTDAEGNDIRKLLNPIQFTSDQKADPAVVKYRIAVIPKGTTHDFWGSVHAGAEQAARELGNVAIEWKGPINENNTEGQIDVVQDFIATGVDGICLAPNDSQGLIDAVRGAGVKNIPVVIFDSGLEAADAYVSYVATDNYRGGVLAAHRLAKVLAAPATGH